MPRDKHTKHRARKMPHKTASKSSRFASGITSNRLDNNNRMSGISGNGAGVMGKCPSGYYRCGPYTPSSGQCVQSRAECLGLGTTGGTTGVRTMSSYRRGGRTRRTRRR